MRLWCLRTLKTFGPRTIPVPQRHSLRLYTRHLTKTVMSDEAYSSFLDQANQDTGSKSFSTSSKDQKNPAKAVDTDVPDTLRGVQSVYTTDADEPFEPVSLKWEEGKVPDASKCCVCCVKRSSIVTARLAEICMLRNIWQTHKARRGRLEGCGQRFRSAR